MDSDPGLTAQLAPLETALLAAARDEAAATIRDASAHADALRNNGAARARTLVEGATADGTRAAERETARRRVQAQRAARALVLGAERAAYDAFTSQAADAARSLREHPEYARLEAQLTDAVHRALGDDAEITRDSGGAGGIEARNGSRSVDLTLPTLARRCVARLGGELSRLWS